VSQDHTNREPASTASRRRLQPPGSQHSKIIHGLYSCDTVMFPKDELFSSLFS